MCSIEGVKPEIKISCKGNEERAVGCVCETEWTETYWGRTIKTLPRSSELRKSSRWISKGAWRAQIRNVEVRSRKQKDAVRAQTFSQYCQQNQNFIIRMIFFNPLN